MRLTYSKSPNAINIFVIEDVNENGKRTTRVVEALGSVKELEKKLNGEDPTKWAEDYVKKLNEKKKMEEETIIQKLSTAKQIPKMKSTVFKVDIYFFKAFIMPLAWIKSPSPLPRKARLNIIWILFFPDCSIPGSSIPHPRNLPMRPA